MLIYKITNTINGKVYIGQTRRSLEKRMRDHMSTGRSDNWPLKNAVTKYGPSAFKIEPIFSLLSTEYMDEAEVYFISAYNATDRSVGYNLSPGGRNFLRTEATKERHRVASKKAWNRHDVEKRKKIIEALHAPEALKKNAEAQKRKWESLPEDKKESVVRKMLSGYTPEIRAAARIKGAKSRTKGMRFTCVKTGRVFELEDPREFIKQNGMDRSTCHKYAKKIGTTLGRNGIKYQKKTFVHKGFEIEYLQRL